MKGIVFTEFLEMVEKTHSPELADRIILQANVPSGGAYTAVGTYDHREMVALLTHLAQATGQGIPELLRGFGRHLFGRFVELFPEFFEGGQDALGFLVEVETHIHVEVLKLYPDAQLPRFEAHRPDAGQLVLDYRSERALHDLAQGLIEACITHFGEPITLRKEVLDGSRGTHARFHLSRATKDE